jgi:hypothetical protein
MAQLTTPYLIQSNDYFNEGVSKYAFFYQFILFEKKKKHLIKWWRVGFAVLLCLIVGCLVVGVCSTILLLLAMGIVDHLSGAY